MKKTIRIFSAATLLCSMFLILQSCNGSKDESLELTPKNAAGTWRFATVTINSGSTKTFDHYYYIDLNSNGNYLAEEFDTIMYEYDCGKWTIKGDSLLTISNNIHNTRVPLGTIDRLTKDTMYMTYTGATLNYKCVMVREDSATRLRLPLRLLDGKWNAASKVVKDSNNKEVRTNIDGMTFVFYSDTAVITYPDGRIVKSCYNVDYNNDFCWANMSGHALHITPSLTILKIKDSMDTYYFLSKVLASSDKKTTLQQPHTK